MVKMTMAPLTVEEERGMTGKFVAKQKREEKKRKKEEEGLAQLERKTTGLLSTPEGGHMCINPHAPPETANYLFRHNQVLGEDLPQVVGLCEYCAQQIKLTPIEKTEIESSKIFKNLVSIANKLDAKGLYKEAGLVDKILKKAKEGIPNYQYKKLKECIDKGMSYEECKELIPNLTQENYSEMKSE